MAADDLSAPLRRRGAARARAGGGRRRFRVLPFILSGLILVGAGLVAWPVLRDDPLGGEPIVTVAVKKPPSATAADPSDGALDMRDGLGAGADETLAKAVEDSDEIVKITIYGGLVSPGETAEQAPAGELEYTSSIASTSPHRKLAKAPDPGLIERGRAGALPRIGKDGRRPAQVYARPADTPPAMGGEAPARIAILITGLGLSATGTDDAIRRLAEPVSLAFAPYGKNLQTWVDKARAQGHEVALQLPMEPFGYPDSNPGPHTMLTNSSAAENMERMHWLLTRMTGYFAITNYMGAKFTASPPALSPILHEAARRGLAYVDDGSSPRSTAPTVAASFSLPAVTGDVVIGPGQTRKSTEAALARLEAIALKRGQALGVGSALPVTIEAISTWARGLKSRGIVLVPVSALMAEPRS